MIACRLAQDLQSTIPKAPNIGSSFYLGRKTLQPRSMVHDRETVTLNWSVSVEEEGHEGLAVVVRTHRSRNHDEARGMDFVVR